jgi:choline dehydrogenase-like flavoprotein
MSGLEERVRKGDKVGVDVLVVGSGPGGAAAARTFARAGRTVLVVEEGPRLTETDFRGKKLPWSLHNLYRDRGAQAFEGPVISPLPAGRVVGGGSVINSGICFRATPERLAEWRAHAPWMTQERMEQLYTEVERTLGVVETHPLIARNNNAVFLRGAANLGLKHGFIRRNAPGCQGCGVCHQGCPSGGKASVDKNFLVQAEQAGCSVLSQARVTRLLLEGKRCTGVELELLDEHGEVHATRTVTAQHTVLAAGAIGTSLILLNNNAGTASGHVGKHLSIHPAVVNVALFDEEIRPWDGVPQGAYAEVPGTADILLETQGLSVDLYYVLVGGAGAGGLAAMKEANHMCSSGGMLRDRSVGTVDANGWRARIRYTLDDEDRRNGIKAMRWLVKLKFAAGARAVTAGRKGAGFVKTEALALAQLTDSLPTEQFLHLHASHPMGTARLSADPGQGVVDPNGKLHDVDNLHVMDGSIFPNSLGVNPQMTIMAMALHLSEQLVARGT